MVFVLEATITTIIVAIIFIGINTLILWLLSNRFLKWKNKSVKTAFKTALSIGILIFILSLVSTYLITTYGIITYGLLIIRAIEIILKALIILYLIKKFYTHQKWAEPLKALICIFIANIIIAFLLWIVFYSLWGAGYFSSGLKIL